MTDMEKLVLSLGKGHALENYIVPGLRSTLLANTLDGGKVRLFEMFRDQEYEVTPHDHRYSFRCHVLAGRVENRIYDIVEDTTLECAAWAKILYQQDSHSLGPMITLCGGSIHTNAYEAGEWYAMNHRDFHSIRFSRGARVLHFEGPEEKSESHCLVPYSAGRVCSTFLWDESWMMREKSAQ